MPRSLTLRLTLFFGIASTVVLVAIAYLIGEAVERHFVELDRAELEAKKDFVRHVLTEIPLRAGPDEAAAHLREVLSGQVDLFARVAGPEGKVLYVSPGARFPADWQSETRKAGLAEHEEIATWEDGGHRFRGLRARVPPDVPGGPATLWLAIDIDPHHAFMGTFYRTLWTAIAAGIALTALSGWFAARRGLDPVRSMARVARNITASRLDDRLAVGTLPVELVDLAEAFNAMLSRLEDSFRRLSEFSSDLAHELRTPISNLVTQTQVALSRSRSADEYRDVLYSNVEEFERLARMISDMLFLAKADNGLIMPRSEAVDLASEVRDLFDYYDALVEECGVRLVLSGDGSVRGERLMLRRAINNLLANAINYSMRGGHIDVRIEKNDRGETILSVENQGETIPAEHLERIFDRFYRVDPARQRSSEGAGLGLAITKSIVAAHGGRVRAFSENGATRIEIAFQHSITDAVDRNNLPVTGRTGGSSGASK